ncbi:MAG: STAS/SEC14 domain-containing protein [Fibrobacter sp.]|nr:STAS/SEC14 domain-containing protein [Fibrobacter sp.]
MIKKLDWSNGNIYAYEAHGKMTKEENVQVFDELREGISRYGKVRIFVKMPKMAWPLPSAFGERFRFAKEHLGNIERYVLVTDIPCIGFIVGVVGFFTGIKFRTYNLSDELLAKTWIESKHV